MQGLRSALFVGVFVSLSVAAIACSTTVTDGGSSGKSSSGDPATNPPNNNTDGGSSGDSSTTPPTKDPEPVSNAEAVIKIDGTCPSANPCGGNPIGTWDYTSGCVDDVFKQARDACPGLDTSKAKVTVKGTLYFVSAAALKRNATVTISGSIKFPQSCTQGQCAAVENGIKGSFDSAKCTTETNGDCTCTVSDVDAETDGTTYSVSGNTITTGDGEKYDFCINGSSFEYKGKSAGSEEGIWTLKKR